MATKAKAQSRFWRRCRIAFRRFRMVVWCITFLILGGLVYLNVVGLPDFVKRPLITRLQERGLDLEFTTLRLHWTRGFVGENVSFGAVTTTNRSVLPQFTARELELNLRLRQLLRGQVQVDSVILRGGKLEWTLTDSNAPPRALTIDKIETNLRLLPNDSWLLDDLRGQFGGAKFYLSGSLAHASAMRDWQFATGPRARDLNRASRQLRQLADGLERVSFATPPEVHLDVNGDARDLGSFNARLTINAPDADTAWGRARAAVLTAHRFPLGSNEMSRAEIHLQMQEFESRWASTTNFDAKLRVVSLARQPDLVEATATCRAGLIATPWAMLVGTHFKAGWTQAVTNRAPHLGQIDFHADSLTTWMTRALNVNFAANWSPATNDIAPEASLNLWTNLWPYQIHATTEVETLRTIALQADQVRGEFNWAAPHFTVPAFTASLYRGTVAGDAKMDVLSRLVSVTATSSFDPKHIAPLLPLGAQEWLAKFTWATPPALRGTAELTVPAWSWPEPDWTAQIRSGLKLAGQVAVTNGSYRGVHADWVTTRFTYTNHVWELPDLTLGRPEGGLVVFHRANDVTRDYYFRLRSTIDPLAVLPLLDAEVRRGFDYCEFTQPPVIDGEVWGRWFDHDSIGFRGQIALTNFAVRGEQLDAVVSGLRYTNLVVECLEPRVWRGTQHIAAEGITADFTARRTFITNAVGQFDPGVIVRMIGPTVAAVMSPYHFGQPPQARVNGYVSMHDPHDANVLFEGGGADFESMRFRFPRYEARILWQNNVLTVTNTSGDFHGGRAKGWAQFVFADHNRAQFAFGVNITNASLPALVADLTQKTNTLDGQLSGQLMITNAWTDDLNSWNGYGYAQLRDGLLWELPIFGALSAALEVGNNRFTEATGSFAIANSIIYSPDLEMRSAAMRLLYRGTVDFHGNVSARVTADVFRDTPVVGSFVSTLLTPMAKLLPFRISGTLKEPKYEPIYVPKILLVPFNPIQTLEELFAPESGKTNTPSAGLN